MKVKIEVEVEISEDNEATESPWWAVVDPDQNMKRDLAVAAGQITGPFWSREEAEEYLARRHYDYSKRAKVWCFSGYWSERFKTAVRAALKARRDERIASGKCPAENLRSTLTEFCTRDFQHEGDHDFPTKAVAP